MLGVDAGAGEDGKECVTHEWVEKGYECDAEDDDDVTAVGDAVGWAGGRDSVGGNVGVGLGVGGGRVNGVSDECLMLN